MGRHGLKLGQGNLWLCLHGFSKRKRQGFMDVGDVFISPLLVTAHWMHPDNEVMEK